MTKASTQSSKSCVTGKWGKVT